MPTTPDAKRNAVQTASVIHFQATGRCLLRIGGGLFDWGYTLEQAIDYCHRHESNYAIVEN